jgi:hypothetical protein
MACFALASFSVAKYTFAVIHFERSPFSSFAEEGGVFFFTTCCCGALEGSAGVFM